MVTNFKASARDIYSGATPGVRVEPDKRRISDTLFGGIDDAFAALEALISGAVAGSVREKTWAELAANPGTRNGQPGEVTDDAGTHTDPVTGGTVANAGIYSWNPTAPIGWKRVGGIIDPEGYNKLSPDIDQNFVAVLLDKNGKVMAAEDRNYVRYLATGGVLVPVYFGNEAPGYRSGPDVEVAFGQSQTFDRVGKLVSTVRDDGMPMVYSADGSALLKLNQRYQFSTTTGLAERVDGNVVLMFLVIGQSLAQGYNVLTGDAPVSTAAAHPGKALMFDVGAYPRGRQVSSFVDLFEQEFVGCKETVCSGMADVIMTGLNAALGEKPTILWSVAADGGILYSANGTDTRAIKRGGEQHLEAVRLIRRATEIAAGQGKRLVLSGIVLAHGESDTGVGTTRWQYRRALSQLRMDIEAEARFITGQTEPVRGYAYQPCRGSLVAGVSSQVAEAMLDGQDNDPGWRVVGPNYFAPDATGGGTPGADGVDNAHTTARGYRRIGRMFGFAALNDLFGPWFMPMRVIESWWESATVFALKYPYPVAIETNDSRITISTLGAGKGVDFTDGSGSPPAISGIAVSGTDSTVVLVTLASAPTGRRPRAFVASRKTADAHGPVYGVRSGVRSVAAYDVDPTDSASLYHWACTESVKL